MLYTVQISAPTPKTIEKIDITVKSSRYPWNTFAPAWGLVSDYKSYRITKEQYHEAYYLLLRNRYRENRSVFHELIKKSLDSDIALACYCKAGEFCHRYILAEILLKIEPLISYQGELTPSVEQPALKF